MGRYARWLRIWPYLSLSRVTNTEYLIFLEQILSEFHGCVLLNVRRSMGFYHNRLSFRYGIYCSPYSFQHVSPAPLDWAWWTGSLTSVLTWLFWSLLSSFFAEGGGQSMLSFFASLKETEMHLVLRIVGAAVTIKIFHCVRSCSAINAPSVSHGTIWWEKLQTYVVKLNTEYVLLIMTNNCFPLITILFPFRFSLSPTTLSRPIHVPTYTITLLILFASPRGFSAIFDTHYIRG